MEGRRERKRESLSDLKVHALHVFTAPSHPTPTPRPPVHSPSPGWRGHGLTPRVTQSALLRSAATLKLTHPGLPSGKRIPAKRDDSCVTQHESSTAGKGANVSAWGRAGHRAPGIQACQLEQRHESSSVRGERGCSSRALQNLDTWDSI